MTRSRGWLRSKTFFRIRVASLLSVLLIVALFAWRQFSRRRARNDWERPLTVALVVLRRGPVEEEAISRLRERVPVLEQRLGHESSRFAVTLRHPFSFDFYGPVDVDTAPPSLASNAFTDVARHAYRQWRYLRQVDAAADLSARGYDSVVYLVVRPATEGVLTVEGTAQQGGTIGMVEVALDESMVDFALIVAAHELFHTLGAADKYSALGQTRIPEGLAEPEREPRFPQRYVEIMARNRPVDEHTETAPESLDELAVGPGTAREIGWRR